MYTYRFTCVYEDGKVRLVDLSCAEMITLLSHEPYVSSDAAGCWFEVQDAQDRVLYREFRRNPILGMIEVPGEPGIARAYWVRIKRQQIAFQLLVPKLPNAHHIAFWCSPPDAPDSPAVERARFIFKDQPAEMRVSP